MALHQKSQGTFHPPSVEASMLLPHSSLLHNNKYLCHIWTFLKSPDSTLLELAFTNFCASPGCKDTGMCWSLLADTTVVQKQQRFQMLFRDHLVLTRLAHRPSSTPWWLSGTFDTAPVYLLNSLMTAFYNCVISLSSGRGSRPRSL